MTWKQEAASTAQTVLQNPKVAWAGVGATGVLATLAEWINSLFEGLGDNAVSITAILSIVLIYNNIRGGINRRKIQRAEYEKLQMENKALREKQDAVD